MTLDPLGSRDLDQAFHFERRGDGYRVRYAIADVAAFVDPGGPMDVEAHERGETLYAPDENARLYPPVLSEGAASLLPDETRPAVVWTMDVDETGEGVDVTVGRALVRSRAQLDYVTAQQDLDGGTADEQLRLLREVGILRAAARGPARRGQPGDPRAGDHPAGRRLRAPVPRPAAGRAVERADLAHDRDGRRRADARGRRRPAAHRPRRRPRASRAPPADREGAPRRVAGGRLVPRLHPQPQPLRRPPGGAADRVGEPAPRLRVPRVRRRRAGGPGPLRARLDVRPHDRPAPAARRPLRRRGVRRALRRRGRSRSGCAPSSRRCPR